MARETVYFISSENGPIKIGKAKNVMSRLSALQTSNPETLSILGILFGKEGIERRIHEQFSDLRLKGEWFKREVPLIEFISKNTVPVEAATISHREGQLVERVKKLEESLANNCAKLRSDIYFEVSKELIESVSAKYRDAMFECISVVEGLLGEISRLEKEKDLCGFDKYRMELRRVIDGFCGTNWRESNWILSRDLEKLYSDKHFVQLSRRRAFNLLQASLPHSQSEAIYLEYDAKELKRKTFPKDWWHA